MATYKRINNNYTITTLPVGSEIVLTTSNVRVNGNLSATGNITADLVTASFFVGDGRFLTNVNVANAAITATSIANGFSNVSIPVASGNVTFTVDGTANVALVTTQGIRIPTGTVSTSNNTGALRITGGAGVAGNVYADAVFSNNAAVLTVNSTIDGGTY